MTPIPDHPVIRNAERCGYPRGMKERLYSSCDWCGAEIYDGDTFYNVHGEVLCAACIRDCKEVANIG